MGELLTRTKTNLQDCYLAIPEMLEYQECQKCNAPRADLYRKNEGYLCFKCAYPNEKITVETR